MDTDNKKVDENQITGGEKDTLHNAGVDLSNNEETQEEFIDIDSSSVPKNDPDLKNIGLDFVQNKEDLSLLKEQMDKKLDSSQTQTPSSGVSSPSIFKEEKKQEESPKVETKQPQPKVTKTQEENISDLEKEFNQTVGGSSASVKSESLNEKISSLEAMLEKIKEKLGFKKKEVKAELDNLKKVKEDIAKDIENIKELEESEDKIEAELQKIEKIKEEVSSIEKEVKEELNS